VGVHAGTPPHSAVRASDNQPDQVRSCAFQAVCRLYRDQSSRIRRGGQGAASHVVFSVLCADPKFPAEHGSYRGFVHGWRRQARLDNHPSSASRQIGPVEPPLRARLRGSHRGDRKTECWGYRVTAWDVQIIMRVEMSGRMVNRHFSAVGSEGAIEDELEWVGYNQHSFFYPFSSEYCSPLGITAAQLSHFQL